MGDKLIEARKHVIDGDTLAVEGLLENAMIYYNKALNMCPNLTDALWGRGLTYYRLDKFEDAIEDFQRCIDIDPECSDYHGMLGLIHRDLGDILESISSFSAALYFSSSDNERVGSLCCRGEVWASFGEHEAAVSDFDQALSIDPLWAHAYSCRSFSLYKLGRYEGALSDCDRLIELREKERGIIGSYRLKRAVIYDAMGHENKAQEDMSAAVVAGISVSEVDEIMKEYKYSHELSVETIETIIHSQDKTGF